MNRGHPSRLRNQTQSGTFARLFTVADANRALPLVRRITRDIVSHCHTLARQHALRGDQLARRNASAVAALDRRAEAVVRQVHGLIAELEAIGCRLRDWETGKVDFPSVLNGREVYLCWILGEAQVSHWHDRDAGLSQRRPLPVSRDARRRSARLRTS